MKKVRILILGLLLVFILKVNAYSIIILSNASIDDEDMSDITDWTDEDSGTGISSQATFDSKSCMKLDSGTPAGATYAFRSQDIGTFGARTVFSISLYLDAIGDTTNNDNIIFVAYNGSKALGVQFGSNGLFVYNNTPIFVEVGTDIVLADTWQEWTFDTDWTNVDVYLNGIYKGSVTPIYVEVETNGRVYFHQAGTTTANRLSYVDWFKAGNDFAALPYAFMCWDRENNIMERDIETKDKKENL